MSTKIIKADLTHTYQTTCAGMEVRTQEELDELIAALQDEKNSVVFLRGPRDAVKVYIYIRFRE